MADSVKNVTFQFKADTTRLLEAIDKISNELSKLKKDTSFTFDASKIKSSADAAIKETNRVATAAEKAAEKAAIAKQKADEKAETAAKKAAERAAKAQEKAVAAAQKAYDKNIENQIKAAEKQQLAFTRAKEAEAKSIAAQENRLAKVAESNRLKALRDSDLAAKAISNNQLKSAALQVQLVKETERAKNTAFNQDIRRQTLAETQRNNSVRNELALLSLTENARRNAANEEIKRATLAERIRRNQVLEQGKQQGSGFLDTLKGGLAAFGIVATADALVDLGKSTIQAAVDFEKLTASFRALIGDKERADQAIVDIQQFALQTPFDVTQIAQAGKTLLGYGINVEDLIPTLKQLGDVSAASGGDIGRVALAFGQVAAKGKLQGEEIRQLVNVGFNPLQEISRKTGESMAALAKRVEEGRVTFDEVAEAFRVATSEGGRFFNLAATLNDTLGGQIQKLGEQINLFKIEVGSIAGEDLRPLVEEITRVFSKITEFTQNLRQNALALGLVKAAIGFIVALLLKSANAFATNLIATKNWSGFLLAAQKNVLAFSFALRANSFAIGTNTAAQRTAAIATTAWDAVTKTITVTTNLFGKALSSLFGLIASNPIGVLIAAYTILNALKEKNAQASREEFLAQQGLIDITQVGKQINDEAIAAIKTKQKLLEIEFRETEKLIRQQGTQTEASKAAIAALEKKYQVDLSDISGTNEKNKAASLLNKTLQQLITYYDRLEKKQAAINIINKAQFDLTSSIRQQKEGLDEIANLVKAIERERKILDTLPPVDPEFVTQDQSDILNRITKYQERIRELNELLPKFNENIEKDYKEIQKQEQILADIEAELLTYGIGFSNANKNIEKQIDLLQALDNAYKKLSNDLTDLILKQRELEISFLPEDTEEQQIQKAFRALQAQRDANNAAFNEEARSQEALLAEAIAGGANIEAATAKFNRNMQALRFNFNIKDENLLISHNQKLFDITQFWIDKNEKLLEDTRKAQTEELLRQLESREQGLEQLQEETGEDFVKAPPGGGRELRQRLKDISAAIQQNLFDQEKIREAARVLEYNKEKEDARKKYELNIQNIEGTGTQRIVQGAKYYQEYLDELGFLQTKFDNDMAELSEESGNKMFDKAKKDAERLKELDKERKLAIIDAIQQTIDAAIQTAQTIIEIEQRKNDELIQLQQERVDKAREIADKGNAALLEAEEKRLTELQKKRARFVRQQQGLILAQTIAESTLAIARAAADGGGFASAITIAATLAALAAGIAQARAQSTEAIGGFAEGGWTGKGGKYEPAGVVHREEFVVKKGPAEKFRPMLEQMNRGRDPLLAKGMGQQVIMINNVGMEERLARIEKAITGQDRMQLTIDESGIHGIVSHYQWKNQRIRNKTR